MVMDLDQNRFDSFDELYVYCYRVAGTVGLMTMPIMGVAPGSTFAAQLGACGRRGMCTDCASAKRRHRCADASRRASRPGTWLDHRPDAAMLRAVVSVAGVGLGDKETKEEERRRRRAGRRRPGPFP